ncbi:MAG: septum formation initiator family protein [Eubacteriaceae bacterium]|jgi:cell division protein FtsL
MATEKTSGKTGSRRQKKKATAGDKKLALVLILVFICAIGILFQSSTILSLNKEVSSLEQELQDAKSEVDSKKGRLISSTDLNSIEAQARALGMTEATSSQYVYETSSAKNLNNSGKQPGLYEYLSMFRQIREGNLWP